MLVGWKRVACAFGALSAAMVAAQPSEAAEGGVVNYAPGAGGPFVGLLPPIPGLFYLNQGFYSPPASIYGNDGKKLNAPLKVESGGDVNRFIASYGTFYGLQVYQQAILTAVGVSATSYGQNDRQFGLANVVLSPVILSKKIDDFQAVTGGLDISTGLGSYNYKRATNIAVGYTTLEPVLAYRYINPVGFTFGAATRLLFNLENGDTHYQTGTTSITEGEFGYSFDKFRLSAVGYYARQIEDDRSSNVRVAGGNRYAAAGIGPSLTYNMGPIVANVNYEFGIMAKNTSKSDTLWLNLAVPLYVPPPPRGEGPVVPSGSSSGITARP